MITVSNDFKTAIKAVTRQISGYLDYGVDTLDNTDLRSIRITAEGGLARTVMRSAKVSYFNSHPLLENPAHIFIGVKTTTYEYIDFGTFKAIEPLEVDQATNTTTVKMYDLMFDALQPFNLTLEFPITLGELLQAICTELGWTLATTTFNNSTESIATDIFTDLGLTYRDILDDIAEASGSIIMFNTDDELIVKEITGASLENLDKNVLFKLEIDEANYGAIDTVILSRQPQEDNIMYPNIPSPTCEYKIFDNVIVDPNREDWIEGIADNLVGLTFYPFTADGGGLIYLEVGDKVTLKDPQNNSFASIILGYEIIAEGGLRQTFTTKRPDATSTNYGYAGKLGQKIKTAEIKVNKVDGEITLLAEATNESIAQINISVDAVTTSVSQLGTTVGGLEDDVDSLATSVTTLEQTADALNLSIQGSGGVNLLKNSVGLKENIAEWQELDSEGDPLDARNGGTIIQTTDVKTNTESGSAIQLLNQFILQTFPTITGENYVVYLRYKSDDDSTLRLTGISDITIPESATWTTFKYQFVATSASTTLRLETSTGITLTASDMVCKIGDAFGWVQAPNEVYGTNFRFDKDGFKISSSADDFESTMTNTEFRVDDSASGKNSMTVGKDYTKLSNATVQENLVVQRYENPASSFRAIPTDSGIMFVIND